MYLSTKILTGFSCAFRQPLADSHCRFNHGYDLQFKLVFAANDLDARNWVVDFGSLKSFKGLLEDAFDHKTVIAEDDPHLEYFKQGHALGVLDLRILPKVGCEAFAKYVAEAASVWIHDAGYAPRVRVLSVEVRENQFNSAIYNLQQAIVHEAFLELDDIKSKGAEA